MRWAELTVGLLVVLLSRELGGLVFPLPPVLAAFGVGAALQLLLVLLAARDAAAGGSGLRAGLVLAFDAAAWLPVLLLTGGVASPYLLLLVFPAAHAGLLCRRARDGYAVSAALVALLAVASLRSWPDAAGGVDGRLALGMALMLGALMLSVTYLVRTAGRTLPAGWVATPEPVDELAQRSAAAASAALREQGDLAELLVEMLQALRRLPGVQFAAVIAAPGWAELCGPGASGGRRCLALAAGQTWPEWLELPREAAIFFDLLHVEQTEPFRSGGAATLRAIGFPPAAAPAWDAWTLTPVGEPGRAALIVLAGTRRGESDEVYLRAAMARLAGQLAPLLAAGHHLARVRRELATLHAENETLTRINKMQGDFVAVASHELKTPLTSISAYTEALLRQDDLPAFTQTREFLGVIREESERLLRMVNRILDFSRSDLGERLLNRQVVDLEPLVRDTVRALEPLVAARGLRLDIACPSLLPRVEVDPDLIRQVLMNLLNNAVKYTPAGGLVCVRACEDAATVRVTVSDTGPGIPPEDLRRIFRQFYRVGGGTEGVEGQGLGLAIVKNIIDLHGGHIDVQSVPGEGASFTFHLPKEHQLNPVTAAILGDLTTRPQFQQLLRLTVRMIAEMTESKIVSLMLLDREGRNLVVQSAYGLNEGIVKSAHVAVGKGIAGRVLQSGRPLLVKDVERDGLLAAGNRDQYETNSLLSVPLVVQGRPLGVINVNNKVAGGSFNEDDLALLVTLAEKVSAALTQAMQADSSARRVEAVVDALQALILMKRSAIPTASPLALRLLVRTARRLDMSGAEVARLQYVASLHDVGMVAVDEDIVLKAGPLTADEREEVGQHPAQGVTMVAPLLQTPEMESIILAHHERPDGRGYPRGLQGADIPLGARVLAVLDAFFAMTQRRPYRARLAPDEIMAEIKAHAGTQFDPVVVEAFLAVLREEGLAPSGGLDADHAPAGAAAGRARGEER